MEKLDVAIADQEFSEAARRRTLKVVNGLWKNPKSVWSFEKTKEDCLVKAADRELVTVLGYKSDKPRLLLGNELDTDDLNKED